jgi:hypothetical protein
MERKTALITGATSGIGRVFADRFAERGYDLIITGRRKKIIDEAAEEISKKFGVTVKVIIAELSEENGIKKVMDAIKKSGSIDALVNNAGFGGKENLFHKVSIDSQIKMIQVHISATVRLTHAVIPGMINNGEGIIINVSSVGAFFPMPGNSIYGSTKAFLNVFSESIHTELKDKGIKIQALCPGFTSTDFHKQMGIDEKIKNDVKHWMSPEDVVDGSLKALDKNKIIYIAGLRNRLLCVVPVILPKKFYYWIMKKVTGKYIFE